MNIKHMHSNSLHIFDIYIDIVTLPLVSSMPYGDANANGNVGCAEF